MFQLPEIALQDMLEAGVHFGHSVRRRNPRMSSYIKTTNNGSDIIDLGYTIYGLKNALRVLHDVVANGGKVLFVSTHLRNSCDMIAEYVGGCGQHYINYRWPGGMLTNWNMVSRSITRLKRLEEFLSSGNDNAHTKKEILYFTREKDKLYRCFNGVRNMNDKPDIVFVISATNERVAVQECIRSHIPVIAILDTDSKFSMKHINYPIIGNDDSIRSVRYYMQLASKVISAALIVLLSKPDSEDNSDRHTKKPYHNRNHKRHRTTDRNHISTNTHKTI